MPYSPARCDTVMIPTGDAGDHLFVITTDACPQGKHILVNLTSIKPGRSIDTTCVVQPGEHPFVVRDSYVVYRSAQMLSAQKIGQMVDSWVYRKGQPATEPLTDKILAGFSASQFTPRFILNHLRSNGLLA